MSTTELEQRAAELRVELTAPTDTAHELAEVERQIAAAREQEAQAGAERWLLGNGRAIGSLAAQLDQIVERLRENPNRKDVEAANATWAKICERQLLAFCASRRFPDAKVPNVQTGVPPGRRGLDDEAGLSIATWQRPFHPVILAWWPDEVKWAAFQWAAHTWLMANLARLPEDLREVLATAPAVPEFVEPTDPEPRGNEAAVLARLPSKLGQAAR